MSTTLQYFLVCKKHLDCVWHADDTKFLSNCLLSLIFKFVSEDALSVGHLFHRNQFQVFPVRQEWT